MVVRVLFALILASSLGLGLASGAELEGYWTFDNPANIGEDSGPHGYHLTSPGTPTYFANGKFDGAVDLDGPGSNDPLRLNPFPANIPTGDASYSVYAWVNPDSNNPGGGGIISWGNNSNNQKNATRTDGPTRYHHYWWANDLNSGERPDQWTGDPPNGWHQVAVTYNAATDEQIFYVDGVPANARVAGGLNSQPTNFFVGQAGSVSGA